jgi:hypothetical protein
MVSDGDLTLELHGIQDIEGSTPLGSTLREPIRDGDTVGFDEIAG